MTIRRLEKEDWTAYFDGISKTLGIKKRDRGGRPTGHRARDGGEIPELREPLTTAS